jgi:peptidoglycan/LPS O-acetylase OafA/YrhL
LTERGNNFDLLRLIFAGSVLAYHGYELSRAAALEPLQQLFSADLAVKAFFVVSGYLVVMSCERSSSLATYGGKRVRRIYPAYAAIVILCALAGALLTTLGPAEYFLSAGWWRYLAANLVFLNFLAPELPGVFAGNTWTAVNGALWTLKIEVMFYALVPVLVWACRRFGAAPVLVSLYAASVAYDLALGALHQSSGRDLWYRLQHQLPGVLTYFLVGAALWLYRDRLRGRWGPLLIVALVAFALTRIVPSPLIHALLEPLGLGIGVVFAAVAVPFLGNFARFGDLSYGLYIIHFPVIQTAVAAGLFKADPAQAFLVCAAATAFLAWLSWHLVEKPFLARRSHYRLAEQGAVSRARET